MPHIVQRPGSGPSQHSASLKALIEANIGVLFSTRGGPGTRGPELETVPRGNVAQCFQIDLEVAIQAFWLVSALKGTKVHHGLKFAGLSGQDALIAWLIETRSAASRSIPESLGWPSLSEDPYCLRS